MVDRFGKELRVGDGVKVNNRTKGTIIRFEMRASGGTGNSKEVAIVKDEWGEMAAHSEEIRLDVPAATGPKKRRKREGLKSMSNRLSALQREQDLVRARNHSPHHDQHLVELAAKEQTLEAEIKARKAEDTGPRDR